MRKLAATRERKLRVWVALHFLTSHLRLVVQQAHAVAEGGLTARHLRICAAFPAAFRGRVAIVAQLVRAPVCGTGGRGFEPRRSPHFLPLAPGYEIPFGGD